MIRVIQPVEIKVERSDKFLETLQQLPEKFVFSKETRDLIRFVDQAERVEDFDVYSLGQLEQFVQKLNYEADTVENELLEFMRKINKARPMPSPIDFF